MKMIFAVLLVLCAAPSWAMEHYIDSVRHRLGYALPGVQITIYNAGASTLATIYSGNGTIPKANPFTSNDDGSYEFYAPNGAYDIRFSRSGTNFSMPNSIFNRVILFDKDDATANGTNCPSGQAAAGVDAAGNAEGCFTPPGSGGGSIGGTAGTVDNACLRADGTGGSTIQGSLCTIGDDGTITTPGGLTLSGSGTSVDTVTEGPNPGPSGIVGQHVRYTDQVTGRFTDFKTNGVPMDYADVSSPQAFSNKIIDGAWNTIVLMDDYWVPTARCDNATAVSLINLPTTNAATSACDTGTNQFSAYLQFADAANQSAHYSFILPDNYAGSGIGWNFRYHIDAGTTGNVGLCVQLVRVPAGSSRDPAFPALSASNCVYSPIPGTAGQEAVLKVPEVFCLSCIPGDRIIARVSRDGNGTVVSDSATGNMRLTFTGPRYAKRSR